MKKILVFLAEGFEEMEAVITIDMLRRAGLDVKAVAVGDSDVVKASRGVKIQCDLKAYEITELPDAIVLPGGMPGAENLTKSPEVKDLIIKMNNKGKLIAAICAAPSIVLSPLEILKNKKVTCYPKLNQNFDSSVKYSDKKVITDGNLITSKGPGTAFYFALEIIRYLLGEKKADEVKQKALV